MEEDREILENLLKNANPFTMSPRIYIALENLIKGYKEKDIEINKLNKIIDNMADFIFTYDCCSHFAENRVKCKMKGFETTLGNCKNNCIKDYFRKKVENE